MSVRAFQNTCRHRGVRLVQGSGTCDSHLTCPFHGWCYGKDGANTRIPMRKSFGRDNLDADDVSLVSVRCELWGACAWINLDADAPPLRECIEPAASILDAWQVESLRTEWWYACRLPVNWKLAQQAFQEQYHVVVTHPQLVIPGMRYGAQGATFDPRHFVDAELQYLRTMSEGMAGMVHATDVEVAEGLRDLDLPGELDEASAVWNRTLNDAVVERHRSVGADIPDLNQLAVKGQDEPMGYVFPHYFVLPMYSSASSYRFRPLGPEETLMEIWSLTRPAAGEERPRPTPPEVWECDDPRWPPIPAQDFSNLPRQQKGLHNRGFEFMRLSEEGEGHLSNFERVLDGFLAGRPTKELLPALREVNVNPLTRPIVDLDL
jgi:phenylpropionate dioxygenase-like ring-hydroxylating dioxygenase large terminal subunit